MSLKFINVVYMESVYIKSFWYRHRWYTPIYTAFIRKCAHLFCSHQGFNLYTITFIIGVCYKRPVWTTLHILILTLLFVFWTFTCDDSPTQRTLLYIIFCIVWKVAVAICRKNLAWPLAVRICRGYLCGICCSYFPWLFAVGICRGLFLVVYLPWEFVAANCRDNLPWLFAVGTCRSYLQWEFAVGFFCVCKQTFFLCEQIVFLCKQIFFIWKPTFFICEQNFFYLEEFLY